jgi:hypothetical protein
MQFQRKGNSSILGKTMTFEKGKQLTFFSGFEQSGEIAMNDGDG